MIKNHTVYTVTQFMESQNCPTTAPFTLLTNRDDVFDDLDKRCPEWREDMFPMLTPYVVDGWCSCQAFTITDEQQSTHLIFTKTTHTYSMVTVDD